MLSKQESTAANANSAPSPFMEKNFLGREFLTWLWFFAEDRGGESSCALEINSKRKTKIRLWLDDQMTLESNVGGVQKHNLRGGAPSHSPEASAALSSGKTPSQMKLGLTVDNLGDFIFNLSSLNLTLSGIELPEAEHVQFEQPLLKRLSMMRTLSEMLDHLFSLFIDERTSDSWDNETRKNIALWIRGRAEKDKFAKLEALH